MSTYYTIHAHAHIQDKKVTNMTDILSMIYDKFPETQEPPVSNVLLIFNREFMEAVHGTSSQGINANKEAKKAFSDAHIRNLTIHNLNVIDEIVESGLWNGRVRVVEAGSELVRKEAENPYYSYLFIYTITVSNENNVH